MREQTETMQSAKQCRPMNDLEQYRSRTDPESLVETGSGSSSQRAGIRPHVARISAAFCALGLFILCSPTVAASSPLPSLISKHSVPTAAGSTIAVSLNGTANFSNPVVLVATQALPAQQEPVVKRADPAANQLRWITAALLALSATTFIGTYLFWRATRPGRESEGESAEEWFDKAEGSGVPKETPLFAAESVQEQGTAEPEIVAVAPAVVAAPEPAEGVVVAPVESRGGSASLLSGDQDNVPGPVGETGDPAAPIGRKARRKAASSTAIPAAEVLAALKAAEAQPAPVAPAPMAPAPAPAVAPAAPAAAPAPAAPAAPAPTERPQESRSIFDALSAVPDMQSSPVHFDDPPIPAPRQQQPPAEPPERRSDRPESGLQRPRRDEPDQIIRAQRPQPEVSGSSHAVPETPDEGESGRRQLTTRENGPFNIEDEFEF